MAMNYVGSISIIDRGDAPAQAIIDKYHRSMAKRVADETKEELEAVLKRVDNIYGNFELSSSIYETNRAANTEYVNDLMELEEMIKDQVKKKKYQQQVTIFIVGYENVCGQKLKLLQQVNEFFTDNAAKFDEEEMVSVTSEREQFDLEEMSEAVENTLATCNSLAERLGEINHEMADYIDKVVSSKASNKSKKKMEKALSQAKSEIETLNDKLRGLQEEIEEKEDKIQQMFKQIELKNMECQRYKTAAEVAKKSAEESERLREEIGQRDRAAADLRKEIDKLQIEVGQMSNSREQSQARSKSLHQENQTRVDDLQKNLEQRHVEEEERRRVTDISVETISHDERMELQRIHEIQIGEMKEATRREVEQLRQQHTDEIRKMLEDSGYFEESRTSLKTNKQEPKPNKNAPVKSKKREVKGTSEVAVQDDGQGPDSGHSESTTSLKPVTEAVDFDDQFPLEDDDAWATVPPAHLAGRFVQYRQLTKEKLDEMQETIDVTIKRTIRKMNTLKAQFNEHKDKWQSERALLVEQLDQAGEHQVAAEREADTALSQLEEFITEQEKLELEEETRRAELEVRASEMMADSGASLEEAKSKLALLERKREEEELERKLMEQTDDAKAELSRLTSGKFSPVSDDQSKIRPEPSSLSGKDEVEGDLWFNQYKKSIVESINNMLNTEATYADSQQRALQAIRDVLLVKLHTQEDQIKPIESDDGTNSPMASIVHTEKRDDSENAPMGGSSSALGRTSLEEAGQTRALYTLASHLSHEAERFGVNPASLYQALAQLYAQSLTDLKAESPMLFSVPSQDKVAYDQLRNVYLSGQQVTLQQSTGEGAGSSLSARSRTSHHRGVLASLRASADERRARSPAVHSIRSQRSVLSDAELDEDGDMPFPPDVGSKETQDVGTSPMTPTSSSSRKGTQMHEHPIVQEYLRCYEGILNFKDNLARMFSDKEILSAGEALNEIEPVPFDDGAKVQPQIEKMTTSIFRILEETAHHINNTLNSDREYPVSSLNMSSSRDPTRLLSTRERSPDTSASQRAASKAQSEAVTKELLQIREQCAQLGNQLTDEQKRHQDEIHHNTVVMMEMQNTINSLRRELSSFGKNEGMHQDIPPPVSDSPIMFTRLDSERNAKVMKKAVNERRLHSEKYKDAVVTMKEYTSLPAKRFVHLVHKYVHHRQMKQIEENVGKSKSLNDGVFMILDKMEALQNMRAQKWADRMDNMGAERLRLATLLMESLDNIERQSGIFLIKPMYSYRGNYNPKYTGPISNPYANKDMGGMMHHPNNFAPVPTPASNPRGMYKAQQQQGDIGDIEDDRFLYMRKIFLGAESGFGNYESSTRPLSAMEQTAGDGPLGQSHMGDDFPRPTWNPGLSQMLGRYPMNDEGRFLQHAYMNTPRLLELDINRMLIGQNQISTKVQPGFLSDDRLTNAAQSNVRSYVTVSRPNGNMLPKVDPTKAQTGGKDQRRASPGPNTLQVSSSTPPLPPIAGRHAQGPAVKPQETGRPVEVANA